MGNFNRSEGRGGFVKRSFGGGDRGGFNRDRGNDRGGDRGSYDRPQMFSAICAECGKACEVPFKPSGDKPVYCRDCFNKRDENRSENSFGRGNDRGNDRGSDRGGDREMFAAVCDSCGKKCQVPFRPSSNKPIYCSDCFGHKEREGSAPSFGSSNSAPVSINENAVSELKAQINTLNTKLDRVLRALELRGKIVDEPKADANTEVSDAVVEAELEPVLEKAAAKEVVKKATIKTKKVAVAKKVVTKKVAVKKTK